MNFDWSDLAFGSKKPLSSQRAIFILAPREVSIDRFKQLIKVYLPKGNLILGLAKEEFVDGFENQMQFKTLRLESVKKIIDQVNKSNSPHKIFTLNYFQREASFIIEKIKLKSAVIVNGSYSRSFHLTPSYYALAKAQIPFEHVSPFASEDEAKQVGQKLTVAISKQLELKSKIGKNFTEAELIEIGNLSAKQSFDHTFQTGAALAKQSGNKFKLLLTAYNEIVPFPTFAMHYGASREKFLSPANDLNHYDTVHAEVNIIIDSLRSGISIENNILFVNLMPCPVCSRIIVKSGIKKVIYQHDHSDGYAAKLLSQAGIDIQRIII